MEWYGIVTMETEGCNSARPEGSAAEELMTEDGGDARSGQSRNGAEHRKVNHETVPSTEKWGITDQCRAQTREQRAAIA